MSEDDDENIEKLFLSGTQRPDIRFEEDDWLALRKRLDAEAVRISGIRTKRVKLTLSITLSIVLSYCPFHIKEESLKPAFSYHRIDPQHKFSLKAPSTIRNEKLSRDSTTLKFTKLSSDRRQYHVNNNDSTAGKTEKPLAHKEGDSNEFRADKGLIITVEDQTLVKERQANVPFPLKINRKPSIVTEIDNHIVTERDSIFKVQIDSSQKRQFTRAKMSFVVSFAPDFSGTSPVQFTSPGSAFGLFIHYHFKNAFSVSTGAVSSYKKYTSEGSEYQPPSGYWRSKTNGIVPKTIDGSCYVLEIPVMLQYKIGAIGKSELMIASGVSSYLIFSESYQYRFEQPNPGAKNDWTSNKNSGFLFNVVNFSIGYEYNVRPQFSIGLEPYMKVPVKDIGWPKVRLFCTGATLALRYRPLKRNFK